MRALRAVAPHRRAAGAASSTQAALARRCASGSRGVASASASPPTAGAGRGRRFLVRTVGTLAVGAGGTALAAKADEGTARSLQFWGAAFPVYLHYRLVQFRNEDMGWLDDEAAGVEYEALHDRYAGFVKDLTYEMRGFYLKNAQLMSTQDEFVPPQYLAWCKDTQDNCPTEFGPGEAAAVAAQSLGRPALPCQPR